MEQVVVKRLVGREDSRHLVMVRGMDVLINTVARELHLPWEGKKESGIHPGLPGSRERVRRATVRPTPGTGQ